MSFKKWTKKELIDIKCNSCETKIKDEYHVTIECPRYEKIYIPSRISFKET